VPDEKGAAIEQNSNAKGMQVNPLRDGNLCAEMHHSGLTISEGSASGSADVWNAAGYRRLAPKGWLMLGKVVCETI
jgi:hypothetical protein